MSAAVLIPFTILCFGPRMKQVIVPFFGAVINMLMSSILIGWFAADAHHEDVIVHGSRVQRLWCSVGNTAWKCDPEVPLGLQENKMIISVHKRGRVCLVSYASYLVVARHQRLALPGLTTCFYLHINTKSIQSCSLTMKLSIHDDLVSTAKKQINSHSMAREWGHRSVKSRGTPPWCWACFHSTTSHWNTTQFKKKSFVVLSSSFNSTILLLSESKLERSVLAERHSKATACPMSSLAWRRFVLGKTAGESLGEFVAVSFFTIPADLLKFQRVWKREEYRLR